MSYRESFQIEQYDKVLLKDKRTACVVEILEDSKAYLVDVDISREQWETIQISYNDVEKILD